MIFRQDGLGTSIGKLRERAFSPGNWSNAELRKNLGRQNYQLTIESWQEQVRE